MRYVLRVGIPDRPGASGAVASALGEAAVDIESLEVIDRSEGMAYDDVRVVTGLSGERLRAVFEAVPGVVVEAIHDVAGSADGLSVTGLAAAVAEQPRLSTLVEGLPAALGATWAAAVRDSSEGLATLSASDGAPELPAGLRLPCFPLEGVRRLPHAAVLVGRSGGPRFRLVELQRLAELARIAVATCRPALAPAS